MQPKRNSREAEVAASVTVWFLLLVILGTAAGVWIKWFWIGWVMAACQKESVWHRGYCRAQAVSMGLVQVSVSTSTAPQFGAKQPARADFAARGSITGWSTFGTK